MSIAILMRFRRLWGSAKFLYFRFSGKKPRRKHNRRKQINKPAMRGTSFSRLALICFSAPPNRSLKLCFTGFVMFWMKLKSLCPWVCELCAAAERSLWRRADHVPKASAAVTLINFQLTPKRFFFFLERWRNQAILSRAGKTGVCK